jgi:ATP-dependent protease ClpP protease subunit
MSHNEPLAAAVAPVADEIVATATRAATRPSWYAINAKKADNEAEITIYDEIGAWGVTAAQFTQDLKAIDAGTIHLRINTPGGDVFDGTAIHNALEESPAQIVVHIDGVAASAGSFIAMSGDEIRMADNAYLMIHNASGGVMGDSEDMRKQAELLDKINGNIADMYKKQAGKSRKYWLDLMDAETWFTAEEAQAAGLVDTIDTTQERTAPASARAKFTTVYNKIPDPVRRMWGLNNEPQPTPEPSPRGEESPAISPQEVSEMSTTDAPAAPANPAVTAPPGNSPAVTAAEARHHEMVKLNQQAIDGLKDQGRLAGIPEGVKAEHERIIAILDTHKGKHLDIAERSIRSKHTPEFALLAYQQAVEAEAKQKAITDAGRRSDVHQPSLHVSNVTIYEGSAVGQSGTAGTYRALVAGDTFAGFAHEQVINPTSGSKRVKVRQKGIVRLTVATAIAVTQNSETVYASADGTFTLASTSNSSIGKVVQWITGTTCDVYFEGEIVRSL